MHIHNDFGLGSANALAAVEAGAEIIDASFNNFGDRGFTSLVEVVLHLAVYYGLDTGIKMNGLYEMSKWVEKTTGVPLSPYAPIVGEWGAFVHSPESHRIAQSQDPWAYEVVRPSLVGKKPLTFVGLRSGPMAIESKLKELGIDFEEKKHG